MSTARLTDINGYIEIKDNPISKEGIYPYSAAQLGLEGDKIYRVYRPAEELADPECLASFRLLPLTNDHPETVLGAGGVPVDSHGIQGIIGEQVRFDPPYLRANLRILGESVKGAISQGKIELSPGYRCTYEFTPGEWNGAPYDAVQRNIRGNHLALVDQGRTGPDVAILDHLKITLDAKEVAMAEENPAGESGNEDPIAKAKAALESLAPFVEQFEEVRAMMAAMAGTAPAAPAVETDEGNPPPAQEPNPNEAPAMDAKTLAALKGMLDQALQPMAERLATLEKSTSSMDAALLQSVADRDSLATRVSEFVGTFDHARMTTQQVAEYGVEKLGIPAPKGQERAALDAYLHARVPDHKQPASTPAAGALSWETT